MDFVHAARRTTHETNLVFHPADHIPDDCLRAWD
jgi:hypothetical protein